MIQCFHVTWAKMTITAGTKRSNELSMILLRTFDDRIMSNAEDGTQDMFNR